MLNLIGTANTRTALERWQWYGYDPYTVSEGVPMSKLSESLNAAKTARLELKTTDLAKEFIRKAAMLSGQDMTSFIIAAAFEKAETVMERHQRIELSAEGFSRLHQILADAESAQPTQALRDLMRGADAERGN
jgi:uncharacterized protein (DUF1778 family)